MAIEIAAGVPAGDAKAKPTAAPVQLPAELAALQWLQSLDLAYTGPAAELPTEWVLPGAFPQLTRCGCKPLQAAWAMHCRAAMPFAACRARCPSWLPLHPCCRLVLSFQTMELPEVQPGALPRLQELQISVDSPSHPLALPPSWGAPGTLPTLRHLTVQGTLAAPLPAAWAGGFLRLQTLSLLEAGGAAAARAGNSSQTAAAGGATPSPAAAGQAAHQLPPEWGRGFPALTALVVDRQRLTGSFPAAWQAPGAFPLLTTL